MSHNYNKKSCPMAVMRREQHRFFRSDYFFVSYRFGGAEFPPIIMFKIFIHSGGQGVKYYCGKKVIKPASEVNEANATLTLLKLLLNIT